MLRLSAGVEAAEVSVMHDPMDYTLLIFDRLQDCWDPISEEQLCALEDALQADLPDDYRQFLLRFNAGQWSHVVKGRYRDSHSAGDGVGITANQGIISDDRFMADDIVHWTEVYSGRIPETFVTIMDAGGDPVCMDLGEEDYGKIYYWDRSHEGTPRKRARLLGESFSDFLLSLRPEADLPVRERLPAFQAVEQGDRQAVLDYLTDRGKPDLRNARGWTLLMCAARNSWPKIVDILLRAGADPNARDSDGWCPLHHAVWVGSLDTVKHLLAAEADTSYRDVEGRNLAQLAKDEYHHRLYYHLQPYMPYP
jgi:hypothetical protein